MRLKKYNKLAYLLLILILVALGIYIYKLNTKKDETEEIKEKTLSDIQYIENKFVNLFNQINNIKFENYTISVVKENKEESKEESSSNSSSGVDSGKNKSGSSKEKENQNTSEESSKQEDSSKKQYKLEEQGVLTQEQDIDWKQIKNDVEKIYINLYSLTIDLNQIVPNQEDIVKFNKEFDNLTQAVKEENKKDTLKELSILYDYLPKFIENCSNKPKDIIVIKTKNEIFKSYSKLEDNEWENISSYINSASNNFEELTRNIEDKSVNQYNVGKAYILINELKNSVNLQDEKVFLIKYKNLLEELEKI